MPNPNEVLQKGLLETSDEGTVALESIQKPVKLAQKKKPTKPMPEFKGGGIQPEGTIYKSNPKGPQN